MKNRLVYIVLCFLFVFGNINYNLDARSMEGLGELTIVQGKSGGFGILFSPPLEYFDSNGRLITPLNIVLYEASTGQIVFSKTTPNNVIYPDVKMGNYLVSISIGVYQYQELVNL